MSRSFTSLLLLILLLPLLLSLAPAWPFGEVPKPPVVYFPSPHFSQRPPNSAIDTIVIHHTDHFDSAWAVARFFQRPETQASSHYVVGKDGLIIQCVNDDRTAWHAGASVYRDRPGVSDYSIGIELVNDGDGIDPYPGTQYEALIKLVAHLMGRYHVTLDRIIGHKDVAIPLGRKIDPSSNFDWTRLRVGVMVVLAGNVSPSTPFGDDEAARQVLIAASGILADKTRVPGLRQAAGSADPWTRAMAVYMLGLIKDPSSLPELRQALKDTDPLVRKWAVNGVESFAGQDEGLRQELRQIAAGDSQTRVRWASIDALADLRDRAALPLLRSFLREPRTPVDVLVATLHALMYLGEPADRPLLIGLLRDPEQPSEVRSAAAVTLVALRVQDAVPPLALIATDDRDAQEVRLACLWALQELGGPAVGDTLSKLLQDKDPVLRMAAQEATRTLK